MPISSILKREIILASKSPLIEALTPIIENSRTEIIQMGTAKQHFYRDFIAQFTYDSNAIEGNTITLPETYDILEKHVTINGKSLKDQAEILGHAKATEYIIKTATDKNTTLSEQFVKSLHRQIFSDDELWTGDYRTGSVGVGNPKTKEVFYEAPPPQQVPDLMWGLLADYEDFAKEKDLNIFTLLAGFHLAYENIHPFQDGNGRTGRLLVNFELIKNGYLPINIKFATAPTYYAAFNKNDYTSMAEHFVLRMQDSIALYKESYDKYKAGNAYKRPVLDTETITTTAKAQTTIPFDTQVGATPISSPRIVVDLDKIVTAKANATVELERRKTTTTSKLNTTVTALDKNKNTQFGDD
jgi:Fic family protein